MYRAVNAYISTKTSKMSFFIEAIFHYMMVFNTPRGGGGHLKIYGIKGSVSTFFMGLSPMGRTQFGRVAGSVGPGPANGRILSHLAETENILVAY